MIHLYGLIVGIGCVVAYLAILRGARVFSFPTSTIDALVPWVLIPGIIGARLYHLITDWQLYSGASLLSMVAVWNGGIGIYGALIGGALGLALYARTRGSTGKRLALFFSLTDLFALGVPIAQAIGRWGNFVNGELYGSVTNVPWAFLIEGELRHPLFLYESVLLVILCFILWTLVVRRLLLFGKGQYLAVYGAGYATIRFWLEFLREESARTGGVFSLFSIAQWLSLLTLLLMVCLFWTRRHVPKKQWDFSVA